MRSVRGLVGAQVELAQVDELRQLPLIQIIRLLVSRQELAKQKHLLDHCVDFAVVDLVVLSVPIDHALDHGMADFCQAHLLKHDAQPANVVARRPDRLLAQHAHERGLNPPAIVVHVGLGGFLDPQELLLHPVFQHGRLHWVQRSDRREHLLALLVLLLRIIILFLLFDSSEFIEQVLCRLGAQARYVVAVVEPEERKLLSQLIG
mmetsp:Transcript_44787/g.91414  ORF Transcript_44787/g.91414 Transcript_44787/m.91414 type:complete len:205 (-) Transcript_44787:4482-5096(-)